VLIDSKQWGWFAATAVLAAAALVSYRVLDGRIAGGLTGGHPVGLWYGIAGTGLMLYAGLLFALRRVPTWTWLGQRKTWMRGHVWMGLLSVVLVLCHSGFRWGGPLETALWWALIAVIATGLFGLILQNILPRLMTSRVPCEAPYEQIPHLCQEMRRKADALVDDVCGPFNPAPQLLDNTAAVVEYASNARAQLRNFYEHEVRPFLAPAAPRRSPLFNPLQAEARFSKMRRLAGLADVPDKVDQLARFCEERRLLADQERIYAWLHSWLLLHVPLSVALLVLGTTHILTALYY
jgi:hypothetical protein